MGDWDEENRLVSVTITATGHRTEFVYDGLGRRVQIIEKDPDATQALQTTSDKKYLWAGTEIAEERTGTDGGTVAKRFFAQGFVDSDGTILLYTRDHLGSIRELVDMSQTVRARYDYDPYGNVTKVSGDRDSDFLYTGHYWHQQSGLFLTLFRAYDPELGRWLSRDPIAERGGMNLYGYVGNNPMENIDPLGLSDLNLINPLADYKGNRAVQYWPYPSDPGPRWRQFNVAGYYPDYSEPYTVAAHGKKGDPDNVYLGGGKKISVKELARRIRKDQRWRPGRKVQLLVCYAGHATPSGDFSSVAQNLANELDTEVDGANGLVELRETGGDFSIEISNPPSPRSPSWYSFFPSSWPMPSGSRPY